MTIQSRVTRFLMQFVNEMEEQNDRYSASSRMISERRGLSLSPRLVRVAWRCGGRGVGRDGRDGATGAGAGGRTGCLQLLNSPFCCMMPPTIPVGCK